MVRLRDRDTPDVIVIWLTFVVSFVIIGSLLAMIGWKLIDPSADVSVVAVRLAGLTNTIIGTIVGYLAGRGVISMPGRPAAVEEHPSQPDEDGTP